MGRDSVEFDHEQFRLPALLASGRTGRDRRTGNADRPGIAFRDTLQNQHEDARARGETHRQEVYANVLSRLDESAS